MAWGWIHVQQMFIFGWTIPLRWVWIALWIIIWNAISSFIFSCCAEYLLMLFSMIKGNQTLAIKKIFLWLNYISWQTVIMLTNHQKYCQSMKETELIEESYILHMILYSKALLPLNCLHNVDVIFRVQCFRVQSTFYWMQRWPECDWFSGLLHVSSDDIARAPFPHWL